jgi:hypothetical protein
MNLKSLESWEANMNKLSEISEEMAVKLLRELEFDEHLQGTRYHAMSGGSPVILLKLQEAKDFLHMGSEYSLLTHGGGGTINFLDWVKLKSWIADVFGDQELAEAIEEEIERGTCYADRYGPIKKLIEERLSQCNALVNSN